MISLLSHRGGRSFLAMSAGWALSAFGSDLTDFSLGVYLYRLTGQVTPLALTTLAYFLPQVVLGPFGGAIVDHADRKWIMVGADVVRGLAVLITLILLAAGAPPLWMIYGLSAAAGAATSVLAGVIGYSRPAIRHIDLE